ncbi:substrate-binding domain-containing protein [Leifsonia poae]|uniref:substrate-binding domain-containing protein n=1 Tax=Leifsonia poae TaxID=110933 RepID=UPI001CBCAB93|nr:substrate-binding domain-containing protein [Leifsonia poae]
MKTKKVAALCAVVGIAVAGLVVAGPANADPVSGSYVLAGSDTLQDAGNALANGTNITGPLVRVSSPTGSIASYDAFGSAAIQTKQSGPYFARPAGSGDGVKALSRSIDGNKFSVVGNTTPESVITGQVDIARSSSGPGSAANASGALAYVPFGRDAVSFAIAPGTAAGLGQLTTAQLTQIYNCTLTSVNGVPVTPVLPQSASGTRKFFLTALGISTIAGCVNQTNLAENDGTVLTTPGQIIPFSVASWVAQKSGAAQDRTGTATLGSALGTTAPVTGSGAAIVPNAAYYNDSTWGRDTYVVVEYARINSASPTYDAGLAALVDPTKAKSLTNFGTTAGTSGAVKTKFGFLAPSTTAPIRANLS